MTRVAFVHGSSLMSGVEFSSLYLAEALDRSAWEPVFICPGPGELPERAANAGIKVEIVPAWRHRSVGVYLGGMVVPDPVGLGHNVLAFVRSRALVQEALRKLRPALVVTKGLPAHLYGGSAARALGIPCVWHLQDRVSERLGSLYPSILGMAARRWATRVIGDASSIVRQLAARYPADRIDLVWNGVDSTVFSPSADGSKVRSEWGVSDDTILIGCIARLTPWKGQHILLEALAAVAAEFPCVSLVLVGSPAFDGDAYRARLQDDTVRFGIAGRVRFAGNRQDLPEVLAALDLVVHPSLEKDSAPLAVVSAMASGKPVLCSAVDGTAELFEGGDGILFPPGDASALEHALRSVLRDRDLRLGMALAARATAVRRLGIDRHRSLCCGSFLRALESNAHRS